MSRHDQQSNNNDAANHATGLLSAHLELVDYAGDWLVKYLYGSCQGDLRSQLIPWGE